MRAQHTAHPLPAFPVYSCAFLSPDLLVLGGGGGASRSGIKNKLRLYNIDDSRSLELKDEYELERGEDAPMSMAADVESKTIVCGVNSTAEKLEKGENENCRMFDIDEAKIKPITSIGTLSTGDSEDYQKVTVLSPDGSLLAVAGAYDISILSYPSLKLISQPIHTEKEIYDATFSGDTLVIATTHNLLVYSIEKFAKPKAAKNKDSKKTQSNDTKLEPLKLKHNVDLPDVSGGKPGSAFRAARFHPTDDKILYTVINSQPPRKPKSKSAARQAFICKWNTESWTVEKTRKVGDRGLTCFDISFDGRLIGFGSSDLTMGILDGKTLSPLVTILKAHELPLTTIKFNPTATLLVSGSADNSVRVVSVPQEGGSSWGFVLFLLTLLMILLAVVAQRYMALQI